MLRLLQDRDSLTAACDSFGETGGIPGSLVAPVKSDAEPVQHEGLADTSVDRHPGRQPHGDDRVIQIIRIRGLLGGQIET